MILKQLLGEILTEMKFVTKRELEVALQKQRKRFEEKTLLKLRSRSKLVSEARMAAQKDVTPLLGQILADLGFVTVAQLEDALEEQERIEEIYRALEYSKLINAIEIGSLVNSTLNISEVLTLIMRYVNRVTNSGSLSFCSKHADVA